MIRYNTGLGLVALLVLLFIPSRSAIAQARSSLAVAAHTPHVAAVGTPASPIDWGGTRACTRSVARTAAVGSLVVGGLAYIIGRNVTSDRHRLTSGTLLGVAGGAVIGTAFALSESPCWPWGWGA